LIGHVLNIAILIAIVNFLAGGFFSISAGYIRKADSGVSFQMLKSQAFNNRIGKLNLEILIAQI
jgi:hypothetical protein